MNIDDLEFAPGSINEALAEPDCTRLLSQLPDWHIESNGIAMLIATYEFSDFSGALEFVNRVGDIAESFNHHPELTLSWGKVTVKWWTHTAGGIAANDFVLARETARIRQAHR